MAAAASQPFFNADSLPALYAKIKAVDGSNDADVNAFVTRYDMSLEEAIQWTRFIGLSWNQVYLEYLANGPSEEVVSTLRAMLASPDLELYIKSNPPLFDDDFKKLISSLDKNKFESGT